MRRAAAWAGVLAPVVFIATFTLEGNLRQGYDPRRMFVSELALGPRGWIQALNFWLTGALLIVFAWSTASEAWQDRKTARVGAILLALIGLGLFVSGFATMDPVGTPREQATISGRLHDLFGALVFTLEPVSCFVWLAVFRADPYWRRLQWWTLVAGVVTTATVVGLRLASPDVVGLIQRTHLVTYLIWILMFALRLVRKGGS